jgi:hypothetical protein
MFSEDAALRPGREPEGRCLDEGKVGGTKFHRDGMIGCVGRGRRVRAAVGAGGLGVRVLGENGGDAQRRVRRWSRVSAMFIWLGRNVGGEVS